MVDLIAGSIVTFTFFGGWGLAAYLLVKDKKPKESKE